MRPLRVLYFAHGHPSVRPGGAEAYAHELYLAMREDPYVDPVLVARVGESAGDARSGTQFTLIGSDPGQYFLHTTGYHFDWVYGTIGDKDFLTKHVQGFVRALRPDIVHFQHTQFLGYDLVRAVRNALPDAGIVYTLHEFLPICHRDGQMLRTADDKPCMESSPQRCHECFPWIAPQTFFLRRKFIQAQLAMVDVFLAPSKFLRDRYVDWGLPEEKVQFEEYGRLAIPRQAATTPRRYRDRFAFFGQLSPYKGVDVAVKAMALVAAGATEGSARAAKPTPHLWLHGANLDIQRGDFQEQLRELLAESQNVTLVGRYEHDQLAHLMEQVDWVVVPSIWWENSPLVIQEAFMYGRPVICSDIGGMAEKVTDGVNGLHFKAGDPRSLAEVLRRAASDPELWEQMRRGIPPMYPMKDQVRHLKALYEGLLARVPV